jgi:SAM-dependent methyltransferase
MHDTALGNCKLFFDCYGPALTPKAGPIKVVEIGSQDVNGSLRSTCPSNFEYVGVDFVPSKGVDIVLDDPYRLPFADESIEIVLSSSCFEHAELFWLLFNEILRTLKPHGLFYLNAPSNGAYHTFPVDCWRFYPDSGNALITWAKRSGFNAGLLESYTSLQKQDIWNDYVAIFLKDEAKADLYPRRIIDDFSDYNNGRRLGVAEVQNYNLYPEDQRMLRVIGNVVSKKIRCQ